MATSFESGGPAGRRVAFAVREGQVNTRSAAAAAASRLAEAIDADGGFPAWLAICTHHPVAYLDLSRGLLDGFVARADPARTSRAGTDKARLYETKQDLQEDIARLGAAAEATRGVVPTLIVHCWAARRRRSSLA